MSLEKVNGPKSYVADQLPRPVERRIVMDNEKISRSAAIGWIALVGLSIMAAQKGIYVLPSF
jgi:hypothetical protein